LIVTEDRERFDGSRTSSTYRIVWGNVLRTHADPSGGNSTFSTLVEAQRMRSNKRTPRAQVSAPPALKQAPLDSALTLHLTPTTTKAIGGGGEGGKKEIRIRWGHINPAFPDGERWRLFQIALAAGLVTDCPVDRIRLTTLTMQAKTRPAECQTGFFIAGIEAGDWDSLDPELITKAVTRLRAKGLEITPEDIKRVPERRTGGGRC
jgi:hypothetical protein